MRIEELDFSYFSSFLFFSIENFFLCIYTCIKVEGVYRKEKKRKEKTMELLAFRKLLFLWVGWGLNFVKNWRIAGNDFLFGAAARFSDGCVYPSAVEKNLLLIEELWIYTFFSSAPPLIFFISLFCALPYPVFHHFKGKSIQIWAQSKEGDDFHVFIFRKRRKKGWKNLFTWLAAK